MNRKHLLAALATLTFSTASLPAEVVQQAYLKASNTEAIPDNDLFNAIIAQTEALGIEPPPFPDLGENFGYSVAVSGDTAVIGARQEHSGNPADPFDDEELAAGAAYVFVRTAGIWSQEAYLKASLPGAGAGFGSSVALDGDTIVIGAFAESGGTTGINGDESDLSAAASGAAYVFVRSGTTWTQEAYLKASNAEAGDLFGSAVAIEGDTVVVGAPNEDSAATGVGGDQNSNAAAESGAVYLFTRTGTTWTQDAYLKASNTESADAFGKAVAISGDTVAVGAPEEDSAAAGVGGAQGSNAKPGSGACYVFRFLPLPSIWAQQAYLKASNPDGVEGSGIFDSPQSDNFGSAVALSGDLLAVGAPDEESAATGVNGDQGDNSTEKAGAAYLFSRSGTTWSQQAYLKASNTGEFDHFGAVLSLSGTTLVVGAPDEDSISTGIDGDDANNLAYGAGAAYVFVQSGATWSQLHYLKPSYLKDLPPDNDTESTDNPFGSGGFFDLGGSSEESSPEPDAISSHDQFGSALAIDGMVVLAGSPFEDSDARGVNGDETNSNAPNSGAAYAFDLDAAPPAPQPDLAVQQPAGRDLVSTFSSVDFGLVGAGRDLDLAFAMANTGAADLTAITIKVIGPHAADFTPSLTNVATLAPGASLPFGLTFAPTGGGQRQATLCLGSNDPNENPFTIALTGIAVSPTNDQDGDGMSDLAEWGLRRLGFDWRRKQNGLVNYYYQSAATAGLYTTAQVSNLYAPEPLLGPGSADGKLTLTIDWKISDDLVNFVDLPATPPGVSVNPQGDIEFEFDVPGDRAFFLLSAGE